MTPLVSVIIPIKNGERYIGGILQDLSKQDMTDFEAIIVDNGSTDDTYAVARAACDAINSEAGREQFFLFREYYEGVSAARNRGLSQAIGKYVVFVDGDDGISSSYLTTLVRLAEGGTLLGGCGYETYVEKTEGKEEKADGDNKKEDGVKKGDNYEKIKESPVETPSEKDIHEMLLRLFATKYYEGFIWNKIFRKDLIDTYGLWFDEEVFFNEDRLFLFTYLISALEDARFRDGTITFSPAREYQYRIHESSAMNAFRGGDVVTEKETTEFAAFIQMEWALINHIAEHGEDEPLLSDVRFALHQDMIQSELRCFKRMIGKKHFFRYRRSAMRYYAKDTKGIDYVPQGMYEDVLLRIFRRYGWSGCTFTRNPELFSEVGIL